MRSWSRGKRDKGKGKRNNGCRLRIPASDGNAAALPPLSGEVPSLRGGEVVHPTKHPIISECIGLRPLSLLLRCRASNLRFEPLAVWLLASSPGRGAKKASLLRGNSFSYSLFPIPFSLTQTTSKLSPAPLRHQKSASRIDRSVFAGGGLLLPEVTL